MTIFEQASRQKIRFTSARGLLTTEDLWDLSLREVDKIAIALNKELKSLEEESFLETKTKANDEVSLKLEIAKRVIEVRLQEQEDAKQAAVKRAQKEKILERIERKEDEALDSLPVEDLKKMLESL